MKSAIGIGALLEDGIGDTIRVSLTEDAVHELPAAHAIAAPYNRRQARAESSGNPPTLGENPTGTPLPLTCDANWSAQRQIPSPPPRGRVRVGGFRLWVSAGNRRGFPACLPLSHQGRGRNHPRHGS